LANQGCTLDICVYTKSEAGVKARWRKEKKGGKGRERTA
jgi:hypothetical protein